MFFFLAYFTLYNRLQYDTGCLGLVHWDDPEGCLVPSLRDGTGREEEGGFGMGSMCIPVADSC